MMKIRILVSSMIRRVGLLGNPLLVCWIEVMCMSMGLVISPRSCVRQL